MPTNADTITGLRTGSTTFPINRPSACAMDSLGNMYVVLVNSTPRAALYKATEGTSWSLIKTFGQPVLAGFYNAVVFVDVNDNVWVAYTDTSNDIRLSKSTDAGSSWTIDDEQEAGTFYSVAGIGANTGGDAFVITRSSNSIHGIASVRKRTSGGSWSNLTTIPAGDFFHSVATQRPGSDIIYASGGGSTKTENDYFTINTSNDTISGLLAGPDGVVTGTQNAFIIAEDSNGDLHGAFGDGSKEFKYSTDKGGSWAALTALPDLDAVQNSGPSISIDPFDNLYCWSHPTDTGNNVVDWSYHKSDDLGDSFDAVVDLNNGATNQGVACMYPTGTGSFAFWTQGISSGVVEYYETSDFAGPAVAVTGVPPWITSPQVIGVGHV